MSSAEPGMPTPRVPGEVFRRFKLAAGVLARSSWINGVVSSPGFPQFWRGAALRIAGHKVHRGARINAGFFLGTSSRLTLETGAFVNHQCFFDLSSATRIGKNSAVGYQVMFVTATHEPGSGRRRAGAPVSLPIDVGEGCWIGARATIMPGVSVGDGVVIAAGSLVTKDCEPHSLYAGVPAVKMKSLAVEFST